MRVLHASETACRACGGKGQIMMSTVTGSKDRCQACDGRGYVVPSPYAPRKA